jgi:two-component system KDP operon response regulator KdpE
MKAGRILVASNLTERRRDLRRGLEYDGYSVTEVERNGHTLHEALSRKHDLLLMDSDIEGIGAYELCHAIRPESDLGIIILDTGGTREGAIDALNAGADDYLPVPYVLAELQARVRALLRRVSRPHGKRHRIELHDRAIDLSSRKVRGPAGRVSHLTPKEYQVLEFLVKHADQPRTHQSLAQTVWQRDGSGELEYLRVVIKQLRLKLEEDPNHPRYVLTERAIGYRFQTPESSIIASRSAPAALCMTNR